MNIDLSNMSMISENDKSQTLAKDLTMTII